MYILLPLIIFLIAAVYLAFVIWRKLPFLKKITPEAIHDRPASWSTFWAEMVPGVVSLGERIEWQEHKVHFLGESVKLLHKVRLFFLRIESAILALINRLRHKTKREEAILEQQEIVSVPAPLSVDPKVQEQLLILEIAKDPKNPDLYQQLGDIYIKIDDTENARNSFRTVLDLDPENWYAKKKLKTLPE